MRHAITGFTRTLTAATLLAFAASFTLTATASASAADREIRISGSKQITRVGAFRPAADPTVRAAAAAFGAPTSITSTSTSGTSCDYRWAPLGVRISFANFGAPGRSACEADVGRAQVIRVGGTKAAGWHTNRGLYIRSTRRTMRRKYDARRTGRGRYSLLRKASIFGPPGSTDEVLGARISNGRVSSFILTPLAAGD